ncbi:MAG: universal stress protein [Candidatus Tumulicola sp.]
MKTLDTLLVPIDGSDASAAAIEYAFQLASTKGAGITFCHSVDPSAVQRSPYDVGGMGAMIEQIEQVSTSLLAAAKAKADARGIAASTLELRGPAIAAIVDAARQRGVSAIVMGTAGRSGASRFFLGSVTEGVLRSSDRPVFTISRWQPDAVEQPLYLKRIVVAVDESEASNAAIELALPLADSTHTTVELVHILHAPATRAAVEPNGKGQQRLIRECAQAEELLQTYSERFSERNIHVERTMKDGDPAAEIVAIASHERADLIVIGTHGRRGLQRLVLGSVAEHVVRGASVPVAVVPLTSVTAKVGAPEIRPGRSRRVACSGA